MSRLKTGCKVWHGQVLTPARRRLIDAYYERRDMVGVSGFWLYWTSADRAAFRKWRAGFMKPLRGKHDNKTTKRAK